MSNPPASRNSGKPPVVVVLTAGGFNPWMIINHLAPVYPGLQVIEEQPESKSVLLRRRVRRFGWLNAAGQLATMALSKFGKRFADTRIHAIAREYGLSGEPDGTILRHRVESANSDACRALLAGINPDVVVTVSCRILDRATLSAIPCPVINLHSGINPAYRGQMGGYWALVNGDTRNFGATVHLVDAGVDTGETLAEIRATPAKGDSFLTYPTLLTAISATALSRAVADVLAGEVRSHAPEGPSRLWFNVPVWTWLRHGLTKGIW